MKDIKGLTFIEILIYVAITAIFISGTVSFGLNVIYGRAKTKNYQEVTQNLRLAEKRILFEIRNASAINSISSQTICLANSDPARNPTRIYLSGGVLRIGWGGGSALCLLLTNDIPLTNSSVTVTSFNFANLTSGSITKNVEFSLTLSAINPSGKADLARTQTFVGAAEIRSN